MLILLRKLSESLFNNYITKIFLIKISSIFLLLLISISFGFMPYFINFCRKSNKFLNLSNSFSAGIFLGLGFFHILPEAAEILHQKTEFPLAYVCCFLSYAFNLFMEKVAFGDNHNIIHGGHDHGNNESLDSNENKEEKELVLDIKINQTQQEVNNSSSNIIASSNKNHFQKDKYKSNNNVTFSKKNSLISYLLLFALGFHGLFEGISLGIQKTIKGALFLFIAISLHKWAASLTLGISFVKSDVSKKEFIIMILIFSFITPIGIIIGIILTSTSDDLIAGIFLSISVGTFIYIACSEIITDEFAKKDNRCKKFFCFLFGAGIVLILNLLEYCSDSKT